MIESIHQSLADEGNVVFLSQLCRWFNMPRRTFYYHPVKKEPAVNEAIATRIKQFIDKNPEAGYRTVQRIFQLKGWQVRKNPRDFRPRVKSFPSVAPQPNQRRLTDLARVWCGQNRWCTLALVMDCCTREILGWRLSRSEKA